RSVVLADRGVRVFLMASGVPACASVAALEVALALPLAAVAAFAGFTPCALLAAFAGVASVGLVAVLRVRPAGLAGAVPLCASASLQAISQCRASCPSGRPSDSQISYASSRMRCSCWFIVAGLLTS